MYKVYEIYVPATGEVVYVGSTKLRLRTRLNAHVSDRRASAEKRAAMDQHRSCDRRLNIRAIAELETKQDAMRVEYDHIRRLMPPLNVRIPRKAA